jgi:hypothetical protein
MATRFQDIAKRKRTRGGKPLFFPGSDRFPDEDDNGAGKRRVLVSDRDLDDNLSLMNALPDLAADVEAHGILFAKLLNVIAAQQTQLDEMGAMLEAVRSNEIAVKLQDNVAGLLRELAKRGCDLEKPSVTLELAGAVTSRTDRLSTFDESGSEEWSSSRNVKGELDGLARIVANLSVKVDLEETGTEQRLKTMRESCAARRQEIRSAKIKLSFDSIKGDPSAKEKAKQLSAKRRRNSTAP